MLRTHEGIDGVKLWVSPEILHSIHLDATYHRQAGCFCPTAVGVVGNVAKREVLLVKSPNGKTWTFPEVSVEKGGSLIEPLLKEIHEKTGVMLSAVRGLCHTDCLETFGWKRNGFTRGKRFYFFDILCTDQIVRLETEECRDCLWLPPARAAMILFERGGSIEERRMSMTALNNLTMN